jgi:hypothetical protein
MTIRNQVTCDACGLTEEPPRNAGYLALMVTAPDGVNFASCESHLCMSCRVELRRWIAERRKQQAAAHVA